MIFRGGAGMDIFWNHTILFSFLEEKLHVFDFFTVYTHVSGCTCYDVFLFWAIVSTETGTTLQDHV